MQNTNVCPLLVLTLLYCDLVKLKVEKVGDEVEMVLGVKTVRMSDRLNWLRDVSADRCQ
jgi:hypothetical protein